MKFGLILAFSTLCAAFLPFQLTYATQKIPLSSVKEEAHAKININKADTKTLTKSIKGIGLKRAEAIIKYRESQGPFTSLQALAKVPGFGENFVAKHLEEINRTFKID